MELCVTRHQTGIVAVLHIWALIYKTLRRISTKVVPSGWKWRMPKNILIDKIVRMLTCAQFPFYKSHLQQKVDNMLNIELNYEKRKSVLF